MEESSVNKEEQKKRLIEMMEADEKDGLYDEFEEFMKPLQEDEKDGIYQASEKPKMPEESQMVIVKKVFDILGNCSFEGSHLTTVTRIDGDTSFYYCPNVDGGEDEDYCDSSDGDIWELTDKKPMKSREEIEAEIERLESIKMSGVDIFNEINCANKISALWWVLNEI